LHLAVAPVASVLPAIVAGAAVEAEADLLCDAFETPPWPLQAPFPVAVVVVPSLQVLVAPVSGVAGAAGAAAGAGGAAGAGAAAAGAAAAAAVVFGAFLTPPWLLHAPFPVAVDVVPSAHVVGAAESAARAGSANANAAMDSATSPIRFIFFTISLPGLIQAIANCKRIRVAPSADSARKLRPQ
jgi:hypothetical protein